jgi:hypothetical protein
MRKDGGAVAKYAKGGRIANLGKYAHGGKVKETTKGDEASHIAKKETHGAEPFKKGGSVKGKDGGGPVVGTYIQSREIPPWEKKSPDADKIVGHPYKGGGKVKDPDHDGDCYREGGPALPLKWEGELVGSGGAAGRLAKTQMQKKVD